MEITSFILGVCAVVILLMVAGTSVNYMTIKVLRKDIDTLSQDIKSNRSYTIREFDTVKANYMHHIKEAINYTDQLNNNTQDEISNLYGHIDSRVDKLDAGIQRQLRDLEREINRVEKGYKEKINY